MYNDRQLTKRLRETGPRMEAPLRCTVTVNHILEAGSFLMLKGVMSRAIRELFEFGSLISRSSLFV